MATLPCSFLFFILVFVAHTRTPHAQSICETTSCQSYSGVSIRFPFYLREFNQSSNNCGYPGFELSCNNKNQPLLTLPESGDFIVKLISHENQKVWINDPNECLLRRIMLNRDLSLAGSPFRLGDVYTLANYSFFNCPSHSIPSYLPESISCLSSTINNVNYSVIAVLSNSQHPTPSSCNLISSALVPVPVMERIHDWPYLTNYYGDIQLQWENPDCGDCEKRGGWCGLLEDSTLEVACYNLPGHGKGFSRKAKNGLTIGLGIPGLIGIIGLAFYFHGRRRMRNQLRQARIEFSTLNIPHPPVIVMGLDGASIEKYPKTQLGESGRLPKPNDNICSICLCEYQPKETLRTIPECNHYFHANCIDGWLKMNATCPLCRNLPGRSSSSSSSLPSSPTSS